MFIPQDNVSLLQEEFPKKQYPNKVNPTENDTGRNSNEYANYKPNKSTFFKPSRPTANYFRNPVNNGYKQ